MKESNLVEVKLQKGKAPDFSQEELAVLRRARDLRGNDKYEIGIAINPDGAIVSFSYGLTNCPFKEDFIKDLRSIGLAEDDLCEIRKYSNGWRGKYFDISIESIGDSTF